MTKAALVAFFLLALACQAAVAQQRIFVLKEIDDDHIIIVTKSGEQLLLEKWSLRFSPLVFEGKSFFADVTPLWVTIYFDNRDPIKWSVEKSLGDVTTLPAELSGDDPPTLPSGKPSVANHCYQSMISSPVPFLGNGGEIIRLADGSRWKEVSYQYLYLYEYYPTVTVCPGSATMKLGRNMFRLIPVK